MIDLTSVLKNEIKEFERLNQRYVDKDSDVIATCYDPMDWSLTTYPGDNLWLYQGIKIVRDPSIPAGQIRILAGMAPRPYDHPEVEVLPPPKRRIKTR